MPSLLSAYFSHSWSPADLPVNLHLWHLVSSSCHLLIDKPQPSSEDKRPYFISRIESVLRRADVFITCLPTLPQEKQKTRNPAATGDWRYHLCSPYILFELRLAERLDLPRIVLYDRQSRFQPPVNPAPHVRYIGRRFDELHALLASGRTDETLEIEIRQWLDWLERTHSPRVDPVSNRAAYLLADDTDPDTTSALIEAVDAEGFERPEPLDKLFHTDAELYHTLRSLALLCVDVSRPEHLPLYHAAHSLMVPTIRLTRQDLPTDRTPPPDTTLPLLLRGHPAGYQNDLISTGQTAQIFTRLQDRSRALSSNTHPIIGMENGSSLLHERTYPTSHFVFLSHNERPDNRPLVDEIIRQCRTHGITLWEYHATNRSGEVWLDNMSQALQKATHLVALLSPTYEMSEACRSEWDHALEHKLPILPFFVRGRTTPAPELRSEKIAHESLLPDTPPNVAALQVVNALRRKLWEPAVDSP